MGGYAEKVRELDPMVVGVDVTREGKLTTIVISYAPEARDLGGPLTRERQEVRARSIQSVMREPGHTVTVKVADEQGGQGVIPTTKENP